mgnify:CR=1 FL=1
MIYMIMINVQEKYKINSIKFINSLIMPEFYKYVIKNQFDVIDFYLKKIKYADRGNKILTTTITKLKLIIPDYVHNNLPSAFLNILPKSYTVETKGEYDIKNKKAKFQSYSSIFKLINSTFTFNFSLEDNENGCTRKMQFEMKCKLPLIGKKIEKIVLNKIKETNKKRWKIIDDFHSTI